MSNSQLYRGALASGIALVASVGVLALSPANANATSPAKASAPVAAQAQSKAQACRTIVVTARTRVAVREWPFTNADALRVRNGGARLVSCNFTYGNGSNSYSNKCGRSGRNWFEVNIPRTRTEIGFIVTKGYVPATCARVL